MPLRLHSIDALITSLLSVLLRLLRRRQITLLLRLLRLLLAGLNTLLLLLFAVSDALVHGISALTCHLVFRGTRSRQVLTLLASVGLISSILQAGATRLLRLLHVA